MAETKLLAIETTGIAGSVAVAGGDTPPIVRFLPDGQRSAQSLAPTIARLLAEVGWKPKEIDRIAVVTGPGSFTGLRVGVATAKVLAWACNAEIIGIDGLETLAFAAFCDAELSLKSKNWVISVGIDAQRGDAAVRNFECREGKIVPLEEKGRLIRVEHWLEIAPPPEKSAETSHNIHHNTRDYDTHSENPRCRFFTGPILHRWKDRVDKAKQADFLPERFWDLSAATVAELGNQKFHQGDRGDVWNILPLYSRASAAEEKRAKNPISSH